MKRLLFLLAAIIIGGCGSTGDPEGQDWCYRYDFRQDDQGFNIQNGSWEEGLGLLTDGSGLLIFNYGYSQYVQANYVIIVAQRPVAVSGDITISATGNVYGISATFTATLPGAMSNYPAIFQPAEVGISGNAINITLQTSQDLLVNLIEIRGNGSNPFPINMCDNTVPLTPGTDTPTPEFTYTATITATQTLTRTPTPTFTPSPTSENEWVCDWDLSLASSIDPIGPWDFAQFPDDTDVGEFMPGLGLIPADGIIPGGDAVRQLFFDWTTSLPDVRSVTITLDLEKGEFWYAPPNFVFVLYDDGDILSAQDSGSGTNIELGWSGTAAITSSIGISITTSHDHEPPPGLGFTGYAVVKHITIEGNGANPCEDTPTPTPTLSPTAGNTNTPTRTPVGYWTCPFNFANSDADWISVYNAQWGFSIDDVGAWRARTVTPRNSLGIRYNATGTMPLRSIRIKGRTYGTRLDDEDELNFRFYNGSSWTNFTQVSFDNTAFDQTYTLSQNATRIEIYLTVTQTTVDPVEIYLVSLQGQGGVDPCSAATPTATATGSTQTKTPQAGSTGTLTPNPLITSTPRAFTRTPISIPTFAGVTLVPGTPGTGTPPTATEGTPSTAIPAGEIGDETGEIIGFGWQIGWGLFRTLFAWVGQVTGDITSLLTSFLNTPPQAIPGMPQCMTRPIEHDWCAIIYIIEWTILAPDTPGVLIVPSIMILMNFYIFIKFVSWVLRLIRRGESTTNVQ